MEKILYNMGNILDRISKLAENEGVSIGKLEQIIGASKGVLYKAIQKNTDIQTKWVVSIVENYPQYNTYWLLTGKGEMIGKSGPNEDKLHEPTSEYETKNSVIDYLKNEIFYKDQIISGLQRENNLLWKHVEPGEPLSNKNKTDKK